MLKTEWQNRLEDCFTTASYHQLAEHGYYYRRIETKQAQVHYFYLLLDTDGGVLKRSDNFEDAALCLKAAEQEQDMTSAQYSIDRIFAPKAFFNLPDTF